MTVKKTSCLLIVIFIFVAESFLPKNHRTFAADRAAIFLKSRSRDDAQDGWEYAAKHINEPMYNAVSYDPLEPPSQATVTRDLEDVLMKKGLRFLDKHATEKREVCYLVGLEDKSSIRGQNSSDVSFLSENVRFSLEESLSELSELAGAAGLLVAGSAYQRVAQPNLEYYIGQGKTKEIAKTMSKLRCTVVIFDTELSPSQQKNLEIAFNEALDSSNHKGGKKPSRVKVIDRTALILDIFAQHARTREGQLQVQLALLTCACSACSSRHY